jgi:multidrug resistance efflux pump
MTLPSSNPGVSSENPVTTSAENPNGEPLPHASHLPRARRGKKPLRFLIPGAAALVVILAVVAWLVFFRGPQVRADLVLASVEERNIQLKVTERGALESAEPNDVKCDVKAGSRGAPKILWITENGVTVRGPMHDDNLLSTSSLGALTAPLGLAPLVTASALYPGRTDRPPDLLVSIDDSYLKEQEADQKIKRDKAEATKIAAEEDHPRKKEAIEVAKAKLEQWIKGDFPQKDYDFDSQGQKADSDVLQQSDRTAWAERMVKKGYMTASQLEAEQANLTSLELKAKLLKIQRATLNNYEDKVNRKTLTEAIQQAESNEKSAKAAMLEAQATFKQEKLKHEDLLEQIKQCKIYATIDKPRIVVYAVPEATRWGAGANQSIIAQGEPVQYGQKILSLPDLSHMVVNVRIHEAFINHVRKGLPATVRVDAQANRLLQGKVKYVANVASPQDFLSPDVKVYQAYVEIKESLEGLDLKPGLSAVCTIYTSTKSENVLAIPVQAVVNPVEKGGSPRCYVQTPQGPELREIKLGMTDDKYVEVKDGLEKGDQVVLNPRVLMNDKKKGSKESEKIVPTDGPPGGGRGGPPGAGQGGGRGGYPGGGGGGRKQ